MGFTAEAPIKFEADYNETAFFSCSFSEEVVYQKLHVLRVLNANVGGGQVDPANGGGPYDLGAADALDPVEVRIRNEAPTGTGQDLTITSITHSGDMLTGAFTPLPRTLNEGQQVAFSASVTATGTQNPVFSTITINHDDANSNSPNPYSFSITAPSVGDPPTPGCPNCGVDSDTLSWNINWIDPASAGCCAPGSGLVTRNVSNDCLWEDTSECDPEYTKSLQVNIGPIGSVSVSMTFTNKLIGGSFTVNWSGNLDDPNNCLSEASCEWVSGRLGGVPDPCQGGNPNTLADWEESTFILNPSGSGS